MFETIVVGTDGSTTARRAVGTAIELARTYGARLHVVTAYRLPSPMLAATPDAMPYAAYAADDVKESVEEILREASADASANGVDVTTHASPRAAAQAILEVAERERANLIVLGSRGMTGVRRVLGSVPNDVSHHAPCSVLIAQTT